MTSRAASILSLLESARRFSRDFARFAGVRGVWAAILVALGAGLEGVGLVLIIPILALVTEAGAKSGFLARTLAGFFAWTAVHSAFGRLGVLLAAFAALMILRAAIILFRDVVLAGLQIGFVEAQRADIVDRLAAARWDQVMRLRHARITHLMSGDIQRIGTAAHFSLQCATAAVMLFVQTVLAVALSPPLALSALALLSVGAVALVPALSRARDLGKFVTEANQKLASETMQFLGGLKLAMSQNLQTGFARAFKDVLRHLTERQLAYIAQQTGARLLLTTFSALVGAGIVLIGFGTLHTAPAVLITLLLILTRMNGPATQIQQGMQQVAHVLPAYEAIQVLKGELSVGPSPAESVDGPTVIPDGPILFDNVSFRHSASEDASANSYVAHGVRHLHLTITPGEFIGVHGPSGAGKTTFADLLVGLFPPQEGRILVAGKTLDDLTMAAWRGRVAYVLQDPFLFHDTIRRNLAWASPSAGEAEMWDALALAGADGIVRRMEGGIDSIVGERGTLVSGGERQRIALARAILRKPRLLVLDEATSAIDVPGEREILDRLLRIEPRPTIIMIAHRAESLERCGRLLLIENGSVAVSAATPGAPASEAVPCHGVTAPAKARMESG